MKKRIAAVLLGVFLALGVASPAFANTGYEGKPGNQSANTGGGGNTGYEGQPGNQSH